MYKFSAEKMIGGGHLQSAVGKSHGKEEENTYRFKIETF